MNMRPEEMGGVVVNEAINRVSGLEKGQVDDVLIGCAMPEGPQGMSMGRVIAQKAGLPDSVPGATINRFCSSGLQTIVMASQAIMAGHTDIVVAGGSESMSQVPMAGFYFQPDPDVVMEDPDVYISMGNTAETWQQNMTCPEKIRTGLPISLISVRSMPLRAAVLQRRL